ncbi:hypothetical protein L1887_38365 [Cichorium endivia]|nr:hypothetical protein L1887_38365 [Cichorium endivia]
MRSQRGDRLPSLPISHRQHVSKLIAGSMGSLGSTGFYGSRLQYRSRFQSFKFELNRQSFQSNSNSVPIRTRTTRQSISVSILFPIVPEVSNKSSRAISLLVTSSIPGRFDSVSRGTKLLELLDGETLVFDADYEVAVQEPFFDGFYSFFFLCTADCRADCQVDSVGFTVGCDGGKN